MIGRKEVLRNAGRRGDDTRIFGGWVGDLQPVMKPAMKPARRKLRCAESLECLCLCACKQIDGCSVA